MSRIKHRVRTPCEAKSANCSNIHDRELAAGWSVMYVHMDTLSANLLVAKIAVEFSLYAFMVGNGCWSALSWMLLKGISLDWTFKLFTTERDATTVGRAKGSGNFKKFKSESLSSFSIGTVMADVATASARIPSSTQWSAQGAPLDRCCWRPASSYNFKRRSGFEVIDDGTWRFVTVRAHCSAEWREDEHSQLKDVVISVNEKCLSGSMLDLGLWCLTQMLKPWNWMFWKLKATLQTVLSRYCGEEFWRPNSRFYPFILGHACRFRR